MVVKFTTNVCRSTGITTKFTQRKSNLLLGLQTNPKIGQLLGLLFQLTVSFKTRKKVTQPSEFLQKQNPQSHKTWDATRAGMEGSRTVVGCAITSRDLPYIRRICGCVRGVSPSGYSRLYPIETQHSNGARLDIQFSYLTRLLSAAYNGCYP